MPSLFRDVLLIILLSTFVIGCSKSSHPAPALGPAPALKPDEVVRIIMAALQHNDTPAKDAGIATAFAFASPANKLITGPLERFIPMVKTPAYEPMLHFTAIEYGELETHGDQARQMVILQTPQGVAGYLFALTRQKEGDVKDCWMTDGVVRLREPGAATQPAPRAPNDAGPNRHSEPPV